MSTVNDTHAAPVPGPHHVLVTGGAGYIGSTLVEVLLDAGHRVTVLDRFFFGDTLRDLSDRPGLRQVEGDIRSFPPSLLDGVDAVCDLAALSNDPAGELDPEVTRSINHRGRDRVCRLAGEAGVRRYVLASSCSIYGFQEDIVDETSPVNPLTTYAEANHLAERDTLARASDRFAVTALRQATVYGLSRRMRFDLAVNGMIRSLHETGKIRVMRDGTQWRPMLHVRDAARAFLTVLRADPRVVGGQIFNVGSDDQNLQIGPLSERLCEAAGQPVIQAWYGDPDDRSYRVSFAKVREVLGWRAEETPESAAAEIYAALRSRAVTADRSTNTLAWYKQLLAQGERLAAS